MKKKICLLLAACMVLMLAACGKTTAKEEPAAQEQAQTEAADASARESAQPAETGDPAGGMPDYSAPDNWAYFETGEEREVDVFLICPTVDTRSATNSFDLNDKLKGNFVHALDMERGIFEDTGRLFSPYYRQMSIAAYTLPEAEREKAKETAYADISTAFRWYLDNENKGRGIILAGFSQGGEMCLELLKEYYGGESAEAQALRDRLVAVYSIGWMVTEEMTEEFPQIVPASGETDTGRVICFDCEDGNVAETIIIPAGMKALSINPLNWKTDSTPADKSLNHGAVFEAGGEPVPELCGAYIGEKGELIVTDVTAEDYPPVLDVFPEGSYHLYDYMFFFTNLKENVAKRTAAWSEQNDSSEQATEQSDEIVRHKVIIDTDTGADDASALILAAKSRNLDILGVTVLVGNVDLEQGARNALMALEMAGSDAPVYKGASENYKKEPIDAFSVFGQDGMGEADLIHPKREAEKENAVDFILETVKQNPGEIEIIALGPATNIAKAIEKDPETMKKVGKIWSMGTAGLGPGNATPVAEFNVFADPEAYKVMLDSGIPVTVIGLDVCGQEAQWTNEQLDRLNAVNEIGSFVTKSFTKIREFYAANGSADSVMNCDALAMMCVVHPEFVNETLTCHGSCITEEGESRAQVIFYQEGFTYDGGVLENVDYNITLVNDVDADQYFNLYYSDIKN